MIVDGDGIICFDFSVSIDIRFLGSIATVCCGGEGIFNTEMTGPGTQRMRAEY